MRVAGNEALLTTRGYGNGAYPEGGIFPQCDLFVLQNPNFRSGPDETRTRDLRHARAVMFACGRAPLLVAGERIRHKYGKYGESCA